MTDPSAAGPAVARPGPPQSAHERVAEEIRQAMSAVRAIGEPDSADADGQHDEIDRQIETMTAAHDTLRRALSSIER